jgi:Invasion associated locus B (IalB) protein
MMKRGRILLAALAMATAAGLSSSPALAQAPKLIKQNSDWSAFSAVVDGGKTCYILSVPKEKQPSDKDHGDVFFMLAYHAGDGSSLQPQFKAGYEFKDNSKVTLTIDGKKYMMFTRGDSAWLENPAEESAVVESMRSGKTMSLSAFSRRGTQTSYTYSLSGVTASLKDITGCK